MMPISGFRVSKEIISNKQNLLKNLTKKLNFLKNTSVMRVVKICMTRNKKKFSTVNKTKSKKHFYKSLPMEHKSKNTAKLSITSVNSASCLAHFTTPKKKH